MAQIFSPPKKIEATMPSGRKTYRYAGDSDTLKKKIAGLKKSGASGVSVVAEEVTFKKGSPGEHLNKEKPLTPSKEKHHWASKGIYPKKADGSPLLTHSFFKQVSNPGKDDTKLIKKVTQKEETIQETSYEKAKGGYEKHMELAKQHKESDPKKAMLHRTKALSYKNLMQKKDKKDRFPGLQGESVEDVNIYELSDALKKRYVQKANKSVSSLEHSRDDINKLSISKQGKDNANKILDKATNKRRAGVKMASSKLGEENISVEAVNIYELSPETVKSFMQKRLKKSVDHNKMAVDAADKGDKEGYKKHSGLQRKNFDGAMKAIRHAGNTLKRRTDMNEIAQQSIITHNIKSKDSNRPVVKKGTQLEGAFKRKLIDKMEKERLGGGSKPNVEKKKISKAWSDIGYSNEKPKEKKKIHQSFQKGGKNDPGGMGAILHIESVKDYIEVKGGNMSKQEISKLIKNRKKEMEEGKKPGLWDNIHAKRARIKAGSKERMRTPGSKGAPTAQDFKDASESNVAFKNFLEARQINERKGGATAGFLMRQLYLKRLMKRLNLPVSVAAMIDK